MRAQLRTLIRNTFCFPQFRRKGPLGLFFLPSGASCSRNFYPPVKVLSISGSSTYFLPLSSHELFVVLKTWPTQWTMEGKTQCTSILIRLVTYPLKNISDAMGWFLPRVVKKTVRKPVQMKEENSLRRVHLCMPSTHEAGSYIVFFILHRLFLVTRVFFSRDRAHSRHPSTCQSSGDLNFDWTAF